MIENRGEHRHFQGQREIVVDGSPSSGIIIISFTVCRLFTQPRALNRRRLGCVPTTIPPLIDFLVPVGNPSAGSSHSARAFTPVEHRSRRDSIPYCCQHASYADPGGERHQRGRRQKGPISSVDDRVLDVASVSCCLLLAEAGHYRVMTVLAAVANQSSLWRPPCIVCTV